MCNLARFKSFLFVCINLFKNQEFDEIRSSEKERMVDALALDADEGRDKLRKATGSRK